MELALLAFNLNAIKSLNRWIDSESRKVDAGNMFCWKIKLVLPFLSNMLKGKKLQDNDPVIWNWAL